MRLVKVWVYGSGDRGKSVLELMKNEKGQKHCGLDR